MDSLKQIQAPISREMVEFEDYFRGAMRSENGLLDKISHYIIKRKGKQMRPMFVFLSSRMFGETKESSYVAASMIELLHTATLVHDDVVDDAQARRGFFSINALWKNKIAVLVGDYLLSRGLMISVDKGEFKLLQITNRAVKEMSEGELLQQEKSRLLNITEEVYYQIIRQKTASLIAACCHSGAAAAGADDDAQQRMYEFGILVGLAFQVKDDLFDYGEEGDIGKPTGIDIQERKMTLPLIHVLQKSDGKTRREIMNVIKNHNTDRTRVKALIKKIHEAGGIRYATQKMNEFREQARAILQTFPENPARNGLEQLLDYTINRTK